jgi:hypothetical protein
MSGFGAHYGLKSDIAPRPKSAEERNRSRGRALRHGRASNRWNDESVLPDDDEGPEADCSA